MDAAVSHLPHLPVRRPFQSGECEEKKEKVQENAQGSELQEGGIPERTLQGSEMQKSEIQAANTGADPFSASSPPRSHALSKREQSLLTSYGSLLAFFIMGAALIAIGTFISSLTENQGFAAGIAVKTGTITTNTRLTKLKTYSKFATACWIL